jgi:hypothetical protein
MAYVIEALHAMDINAAVNKNSGAANEKNDKPAGMNCKDKKNAL